MLLLDKKESYKVKRLLQEVTINNLFARSVVENKVNGSVYVDNLDNPETAYVVHPYGMSLLFGNPFNKNFNSTFRDYALNVNNVRNRHEWMQAYPNEWNSVLSELFKDCMIRSSDNIDNKQSGVVELNTRVNFKFNRDKYIDFKGKLPVLDVKIVRTDKQIFNEMKGKVVPLHFWNNADDFVSNGVGFSLFYDNRLASTAYSAFIHDDKLELGIETVEDFRGKGFAKYTCSALIDYCLQHHYEPIWACRLENTGSYRLALKLGFEPVMEIPYYRLSQ
jgi:GNAT superfamily N-acetyltransferase